MSKGTTLGIGDVHTRYEVINAQILHAEKTGEDAITGVFVLGDFGFFGDKLYEYFRKDESTLPSRTTSTPALRTSFLRPPSEYS